MKNVLLIDDEIDILGILSEFVEILGHNVFQSESGVDAMEICEKNNIDIILTDYEMPNVNGVELAKKIKDKFNNIKIYLLSGYSNTIGDAIINDAGIERIVNKPFRMEDIAKILED